MISGNEKTKFNRIEVGLNRELSLGTKNNEQIT